ncbi:hypothetical protein [Raineya sp.]
MMPLVLILQITAKAWIEEDKGDYWTAPYCEYHIDIKQISLNDKDATAIFSDLPEISDELQKCYPETGWVVTDCEIQIEVECSNGHVFWQNHDITDYLNEDEWEQINEFQYDTHHR